MFAPFEVGKCRVTFCLFGLLFGIFAPFEVGCFTCPACALPVALLDAGVRCAGCAWRLAIYRSPIMAALFEIFLFFWPMLVV